MSTLNLGPGPLTSPDGSPFAISDQAWDKVHQYVTHINNMNERSISTVTRYIPAFPRLHSIVGVWSRQTFPNIVALASKIKNFGDAAAPDNLNRLKEILTTIQNGGAKDTSSKEVGEIMDGLNNACVPITQSAGEIKAAIQGFVSASQQAQTQYQEFKAGIGGGTSGGRGDGKSLSSDQFAEEIAEQIEKLVSSLVVFKITPMTVIEKIKGDWDAIGSDLSYTKTWLMGKLNTGMPFLAELQIDTAIQGWRKVASEARAFIDYANSLG